MFTAADRGGETDELTDGERATRVYPNGDASSFMAFFFASPAVKLSSEYSGMMPRGKRRRQNDSDES